MVRVLGRYDLTRFVNQAGTGLAIIEIFQDDFHNVGTAPTQGVEHDDGSPRSTRIELGGQNVPGGVNELIGEAVRVFIIPHRVFVDMIRHDTRGKVVRFVEEHELPARQRVA